MARDMAAHSTPRGFSFALVALTPICFALAAGCGDTVNYYVSYVPPAGGGEGGEASPDPSEPRGGEGGQAAPGEAGAGAGGGGGSGPGAEGGGGAGGAVDDGHLAYPDAPYADVDPAEQELDLFGALGHQFWLGVSDEQLAAINGSDGGGGPIFAQPGDIYTPGDDGGATFADHLWITAAGDAGGTADYGKVKLKLAGQSTRRAWDKRSIPNLNLDSNEFVEGQLVGGFEHLRLNNAQVGSIFREWLSLKLYRQLGYPAPEATFAWVASNVWGKDVRVPMVLVERYKRRFCTRFSELGDKCENMWEFAGDFAQGNGGPIPNAKGGAVGVGQSIFDDPNNCQFDECDATRVKELEQLLVDTPSGDGFQAATADYVDWPAFQRFQCLSWVLATGDDALHNANNVVLAEGADGKFRYLPYSTDISLGQEWYPVVYLPGNNRIAQGCQAEDKCWQETIATCDDVIAEFTALDPVGMLDDLHQSLADAGMLRGGDEARYVLLQKWFEARLIELPTELEQYREGKPLECGKGQVDCGGFCDFPENCAVCQPPVGKLAPAVNGVGVGEPAPGGGDVCPAIQSYAAPE